MSSHHSGPATISVPDGHVALVLLQEAASSFYLQIPLNIIGSLCLKPRKYLLFLGWCILGVESVLARKRHGHGIETHGNLVNRGIYHYLVAGGLNLVTAVDLEVIKARTNKSSESTPTRDEFYNNLLGRDFPCPWTGMEPPFVDGLHIIPHHLGSEWFRLIVANRPKYSKNVTTLTDVNDIRNGVLASTLIHKAFDPRLIAILKTPNHILATGDIPPPHPRLLSEHVKYPSQSRYTLQWLAPPSAAVTTAIQNNIDAAFKKATRKPKPSDLLLHYNYGAAAVKCWGRGTDLLRERARPPRPLVPFPVPTHSMDAVIRNLRAGTGRLVESEGQAEWDEDDVMLFLWGNSPAAKERHLKKVDENNRRMEQWREGVPH